MTALPPEPEHDPPERKPNRRRAVDNGSERQPDLAKPWVSFEPGDIGRRVYGRGGPTRAQTMRQRRKGR